MGTTECLENIAQSEPMIWIKYTLILFISHYNHIEYYACLKMCYTDTPVFD